MSYWTMTSADLQALTIFEEMVRREAIVPPFWGKWMPGAINNRTSGGDAGWSTAPGGIVSVKSYFRGTRQGAKVQFSKTHKLVGSGVTGNTSLEGKEESISDALMTLELTDYRHAVSWINSVDKMRPVYDIMEESTNALKGWTVEKVDDIIFTAAFSSPTRILVPNTTFAYTSFATAKTALAATDYITPEFVRKVAVQVRVAAGRTSYKEPIKPIMINGRPHYVWLCNPLVAHDLKNNEKWQQSFREAYTQGSDNPVLSGALGVFEGFIFHEHESVPYGSDAGGGTVKYAKNLILGQDAIFFEWGMEPTFITEERDYKMITGLGVHFQIGCAKQNFDSNDYNSIEVLTATSTGITGA